MTKKKARFTLGLDVWECPDCKAVCIMGKPCKCGKTYADVLISSSKAKPPPPEKLDREKPERKRKHTPKSRGKYIESYLYRDDEE